jgi:membrane-anchored glycerophosphoryl diester phosphodiesterase (GDPDase)
MGLWILGVLVVIELGMPGGIWFFILSVAPCFMVGHWLTGTFSTDKVIKVLVAEHAKEIHEEAPDEKKKSNAKFWFWVLIALAIFIGYHKLVESSKNPK